VATLAGKTYEVQVDHGGGHWVMVDVLETRSRAIELADELLESARYGGARVIAESERTGLETVYEKTVEGFDDRPVTIVAIDEAPVCTTFGDFFELESRRTLGRVLRNYLEQQSCSALELMYDAGRIKVLENNDALFPQAVQQIAVAQTRGSNVKPSQRADELYKTVGQVRKKALAVYAEDDGYKILKNDGVDALIKAMKDDHGAAEAAYFVRHAFAQYLRDGGDWNAKMKLLCKLCTDGLSLNGIRYVDEVLAEILDGLPAVHELLAGQSDPASANRVLIMLCRGRAKAPPNALSCIEDVNNVMHHFDFEKTRRVLFERVSSYLAGVNALTREGEQQERKAFTLIVRDLTDIAGILGGSKMCGAVTQRARIAFSQGGENLNFSDAMARIINLLPHRAARIGYLVELSFSKIARKHKAMVLTMLAKTVEQLSSLSSLVPTGSSPEMMQEAIEGLKKRLTSDEIPAEWRESLTRTFESLLSKPEIAETSGKSTTVIVTDEEFRAMLNEKPKEKKASRGEILFEEGDLGSEAYLIQEGEIEIFQRVGNAEHVIATLGKGEIIGEMSLIDNQPRMASARVLDNSRLTVITRESVQIRLQKLQQDDRVMRRLVDVLVNRLRGDAQASI
jgi:CRP-like cAMP-binding protein